MDSRIAVEIMDLLQGLNELGLTVVLVTPEPDISQFARRVLVVRDSSVRKDEIVAGRPRAREVLGTKASLEG